MCVVERAVIHVPLTLIYHFWICFAQYALFYQKSGIRNSLEFVFQNKLPAVCLMMTFQLFL